MSEPDEDDPELDAMMRALAHVPEAVLPELVVSRAGVHAAPGEPVLGPPPEAIGGFRVLGLLGAGGMGVVYEALDDTLRRTVAVKLLRARRGGLPGAGRLLREAQALARLSHPNVVTVYEAGRDGDDVYLVMERVHGVDARAWRAARPRPLAEILDVYRQAASGLAAAHRAGLVHRDVKPENILVGDDGRVRVTDFGLVAAAADRAGSTTPDGGSEPDGLAVSLTQTGALLGTPPYTSPEAHRGGEVGPPADQFALCVALWEAIAGERPHADGSARELGAAIREGRITRGREAIPPGLRAVLERGLRPDPAARWPSLAALSDALDRAPRRRRRSRRGLALAAGGVVALAGAGAFGAWRLARPGRIDPAPAPPRRLTTPGGCPYSPVFVDDEDVVFDDGSGDLWTLSAAGGAPRLLVGGPRNDGRANRGRHPGEAVFVAQGEHGFAAGFVDVKGGRVELQPIDSASFAVAGGTLFYDRVDVAEVRRVRGGEDQLAVALPAGRWPYTVAASADARRLAITTALDRSAPTLCLADLDPATSLAARPAACLDRADITPGRAAFSPDGAAVYYQTLGGIRRREGDRDRLWLAGAQAYGGIDVAPSGRQLVYSDSRPVVTEVAPADDLGAPVLRGRLSAFASLPGGGWIYVRHEGQFADVLVAQALDGSSRVLTPPQGNITYLSVDAAGRRAAFDRDGEAPGIYVVDLRPYPPVRITTTAADSNPVWTADGRLAFTRWDAGGQPAVLVVDPAGGDRDDGARRPAHPVPRVTADRLPSTGELVLLGQGGRSLFLWAPDGSRERAVDLAGVGGGQVLQVAAAPDGSRLALLLDDGAVATLPVPGGPAEGQPVRRVFSLPRCTTGDRPAYDAAGRLHVTSRAWRGDVYLVGLERPR